MVRLLTVLVVLPGVALAAVGSTRADEFEIQVKVDLGQRQVQTERTVETPSETSAPSRQVVEIGRDRPARISWRAENTGQSEELKDVLVHFFVVRQEKTGQSEVPKLTEGVMYEGALTMDFKPHDTARWQWTLNIHEPGSYLLRVETVGMRAKHGHDHYAAMDLVVK